MLRKGTLTTACTTKLSVSEFLYCDCIQGLVVLFEQAFGLLVSVSGMYYYTYTSDLSTLWSTRGLIKGAILSLGGFHT